MPEHSSSNQQFPTLGQLAPQFLLYAEVELRFARQSILKYRDCLRQVQILIGERSVCSYSKEDVLALKAGMLGRGHSVGRQVSILAAFKRLLQYCRDELGLPVLDPASISLPRRPRRDVLYLSVQEVERFVTAICVANQDGSPSIFGLRFRALVEALLGTGMRIGEALSIDRSQIDFANREAKVIGKGGKERVVFFTDRSLEWLRRYLGMRTDGHPALFVSQNGRSRLSRDDVWRPFARYRKLAGLTKPVTPHLLRHTAATQLLFNGCPIGHIKEILGHERLETTCRYYLGLDRVAAKQAHRVYLVYRAAEVPPTDTRSVPLQTPLGHT